MHTDHLSKLNRVWLQDAETAPTFYINPSTSRLIDRKDDHNEASDVD